MTAPDGEAKCLRKMTEDRAGRVLLYSTRETQPTVSRCHIVEFEELVRSMDAADLLEAYAPNLFGMFGTSLRDPVGTPADHAAPPPPPDARDDVQDRWNLGWAIFLGILITFLFRICAEDAGRSPPIPPYDPIQIPAFDPIDVPPIDLLGNRIPPMVFVEVCLSDVPEDRDRCDTLRSIDVALSLQDCDIAEQLKKAYLMPAESPDAEAGPTADLLTIVDDRIRACRTRVSRPGVPQ